MTKPLHSARRSKALQVGALLVTANDHQVMELLVEAARAIDTGQEIQRDVLESFQDMLDAVLPGVTRTFYVYDAVRDRITSDATKLAGFYGFTVQEIESREGGWWGLIHPGDLPQVQQTSTELATGARERVSVQMRVICKDGGWRWIQHDWCALRRAEDGRMLSALGMVHLVTPAEMPASAMANEAVLASLCQMLLDEWHQCVFLLDQEGRVLHANDGALRKLGYSTHEMRQMKLCQLAECTRKSPHRKPHGLPPFHGAREIRFPARHICRDGSFFPAEIHLRCLSRNRVLAVTRDTTVERLATERTLEERSYYRSLFENNPSGVAVFDEALVIQAVNPAFRKMLGHAEKQLLGKPLSTLLNEEHVDDAARWAAAAAIGGRTESGTEVCLRRRDGKPLAVSATVSFGQPGKGGSLGIAIFTDISGRKRAEAQLASESALHETLIRESAAMIGLLDAEGRILKINPAVERITGFKACELEGSIIWESPLMVPEEIGPSKRRMSELLKGAPRVSAVVRGRTKDGRPKVVEMQNTATRDADGRVQRIIVTAIDITERFDLQERLVQILEQEQARVGHDLHDGAGQLLAGMGNLMEALASRLDGENRKEAGYILQLTRQAIDQIRRLSHSMSPATIQQKGLAGALCLLAETVRANFRRECTCEIDTGLDVPDPAIATQVYRIAQEAVSNALRHGNPSHVTIRLRREFAGMLVLEVDNDGKCLTESGDACVTNGGIGIRVMNYRANLIGGDLSILPRPRGGVRIICRFPSGKTTTETP